MRLNAVPKNIGNLTEGRKDFKCTPMLCTMQLCRDSYPPPVMTLK